jgi:hypothetical protein
MLPASVVKGMRAGGLSPSSRKTLNLSPRDDIRLSGSGDESMTFEIIQPGWYNFGADKEAILCP